MTLIEAIKSGEKFKRSIWTDDDWITNESIIIPLRRADIVADDWEVVGITITPEHFDRAVKKAGWINADKDPLLARIKKELGL